MGCINSITQGIVPQIEQKPGGGGEEGPIPLVSTISDSNTPRMEMRSIDPIGQMVAVEPGQIPTELESTPGPYV